MAQAQVHTINEAEISLTDCGRFLAGSGDEANLGTQPMASGTDVAIWPEVEYPAGFTICGECFAAYQSTGGR